jgi:hypothetical protein
MPHWTTNTLFIVLPAASEPYMRADLAGPCDWPYPECDPVPPRSELSADDRLSLAVNARALVETFRARQNAAFAGGWPDFVPVSRADLEAMLAGDRITWSPVPFSVARLAPWRDAAEFAALFPGSVDADGCWHADPARSRDYANGELGPIALCRNRLGIKWSPSAIEEITVPEPNARPRKWAGNPADSPALHCIAFLYRTPWARILTLPVLLHELLERHGAKAVVAWEDEDGAFGIQLCDPARGRQLDCHHAGRSRERRAWLRRTLDDPDFTVLLPG